MQNIADHFFHKNNWILISLFKSCSQLAGLNPKAKLNIISAFKFSTLIKTAFCLCILYLNTTNAFGNTLVLSLEEYANNPFGQVLFLRHALAPGFDANGKPDQFKIDDCSTQRNLSPAGRKQAIIIGEKLIEKGIKFNKIYSSQWCRCLETAELLKLGEVIPESSLNSGFNGIFKKEKSLSTLRNILKTLSNENAPVLMITHYGTILAITGINVKSGEIVAYNTKTKVSKLISLK